MMKRFIIIISLVMLLIISGGIIAFCCYKNTPQEQHMESSEPEVAIYNVYHKKSRIFKNDVVIPIQAGRALHTMQGRKLEGLMLGDDTGDNISTLNDRYSELTALYWMWKNSTADYVGLMHYRRRMILLDERNNDTCGDDYLCSLGFTKENILSLMQKYDIIVPYGLSLHGQSIYDHYDNCHYISDFDAALDYVRAKYPEMNDFIDDWLNNVTYYPFNMFIMKKELFDEYAAFLFDVLFAIDDQINFDHSLTSDNPKDFGKDYAYQKRAPGFISERLFDLWIRYYKYKVKRVYFEYGTEYYPSFKRKNPE